MRKKVIIFFVIICILSISCISILTYCKPIKIENIDKSKRICDELHITSSKKYMSREDFLGMILSVVGLNENIFDMYCYGMDREGFATDDLKTGNQYQITNDISEVEFDKIYRYDTLCYIACDVNILQTYKKTYEYRGKNYITIKDAIVMIEACLEDTKTEKGKFFGKSKEYQRLFENAQKNIVNKNDMIYWVPIDRKATRDEIYTLLNRLLNQKRYKYLSDAAYNESKAQIDYDRSITYKEYLEQTQ